MRSAASSGWPTTRWRSAPSPGCSRTRGTTTSSRSRRGCSRPIPKVRFVFIGDGIYRERLIAETERLGVRHAFHFVGLVPPGRIPELLGALDAVVHPSLREGLARVLPQALLVGRPVISYDIDGAREVVLPETGILLKPRDLDGPGRRDPPARRRPGAAPTRGPGGAAAVRRPVPPRDDDRPAPLTLSCDCSVCRSATPAALEVDADQT